MRVTLAYPRDGHAVGDTVDLPDAQARQLIADGYARPAQDDPPQTPTPQDGGPGRETKEK